jgi:hypothetical protein
MNSLAQYTNLLKRFPRFELSYETVSHKKVSSSDSAAIAIAFGRKCFIWYTYQEGGSKDACYLIGLDKDKQICSVEQRSCATIPNRFCLGTVVYCTIYEPPGDDGLQSKVFIAEDIYYHCGTNLSNLCFGDRIGFLKEFAQKSEPNMFSLPIIWYLEKGTEYNHIIGPIPERGLSEAESVGIGRFSGETTSVSASRTQAEFRSENPSDISSKMGYTAHHIQYREIHRVSPYINVAIPKRSCVTPTIAPAMSSAKIAQKLTASTIPDIRNKSGKEIPTSNIVPNFDFSKPTYRYPAVFKVTADPQLDLYHLYAYSDSRSRFSDRANPQMVRSSGIPGTIGAQALIGYCVMICCSSTPISKSIWRKSHVPTDGIRLVVLSISHSMKISLTKSP